MGPDHPLFLLLPDALNTTDHAPKVGVSVKDVMYLILGGVALAPEVANGGIHFIIDPIRLTRFFRDIDAQLGAAYIPIHAPAAQAQALCFIRAVPRAPRAAQEIDSPDSDSDSDSDPDLDPDLDPDSDFEMSVPKKKLKVPKKRLKVPKKKPKEARDDLEEADEAEQEAMPEEPVLGIPPVYQLPPEMTPDQYKQRIDCNAARRAARASWPEEPVLGIAPVYQLPPEMTPDQ